MRCLAIVALLALSACGEHPDTASALPPPLIVKVPVPVACVKVADVPAMPPKVGEQLNGNAPHDLDIVSASAIRLRIALDKALALISGCVTP